MRLRLAASYAFSLALLLALLLLVDLRQVAGQVVAFGVLPSLIYIALYASNFFFRAVKWKYILKPFANVRLADSYHIMMLGFFANNLLPARIGEVIRAYALSKKYGIGKVKSFATVVVDRVTDGAALIGLLALAFAFSERIPAAFEQLVLLPVLVFAVLLAVFLFPQKTKRLLSPFVRLLPEALQGKFEFLLEETVVGGKALRGNLTYKVAIWGSSAAVWAIHVLTFYYVARQMGLPLGLVDLALFTALASFAVMVPAAPGYIGTYEAAVAAFFVAYGLDVNQGLAFAVVTHALQLLTIAVLGYWSTHRLGMKVGEMLNRSL